MAISNMGTIAPSMLQSRKREFKKLPRREEQEQEIVKQLPKIIESIARPREDTTTIVGNYDVSPQIEEEYKRLEGLKPYERNQAEAQIIANRSGMPAQWGSGALVPKKQEAPPGGMDAIRRHSAIEKQQHDQEAAAIEATTPIYDPREADFENWRRKQGLTAQRKPGVGNAIKDFLRSGMRNVERMRAERGAEGMDLGTVLGTFLGGGARERLDREGTQRLDYQQRRQPEFLRKEALREAMQKRQRDTELQAYESETHDWARNNQALKARMNQLKIDVAEFEKGNLPMKTILDQLKEFSKIMDAAEMMDIRVLDSESRRKFNEIRGRVQQQQANMRAQDSASRRGLNTISGQLKQKQGALTEARVKQILKKMEEE